MCSLEELLFPLVLFYYNIHFDFVWFSLLFLILGAN